jgi:membrane associated rhomboid family serine protease
MNSAAVGFQCPACFTEGVKSIPRRRTSLGGIARSNTQAVTVTLLVLNVLVFLAVQGIGGRLTSELVLVPVLVETEPWRLITSAFTHQQILHVLSNLLMLWRIGPLLEERLGRLRYVLLYLLSALGGSLVVWLLASPVSATLGASGAVLGLIGALLVIERSRGLDVTWITSYVVATALLTFLLPNISWQGHLGGFLAGAALGWLFVQDTNRRRRRIQL